MDKEIENALLLFLTATDRNFIEFPTETQDLFQEATELLRKHGLVTVTKMEDEGYNITASLTESGLEQVHILREKRGV
ncbi:hypothetical protein [Dyadobacter sp. CY356]|uniref:hypothetical protein n=1 Tax=Dyadobacter sp. CY356 TaxID=2906442 RepID=UPI001F3AD0C4|nr:hypothetical protein [Dyadobacter sp. CY356]MCF0056381.1 hypothetical protein [Dyadobacter sp. CY356]